MLYTKRLREADRMYAWAESLKNAKRVGLYRFHYRYHLADAAYDTAYEILEELCGYYPCIVGLLDRPVYFGWGEYPDSNPESAPRLLGSPSQFALQGAYEVKCQNIAEKLLCLQASVVLQS
jgi:hypothetical protein